MRRSLGQVDYGKEKDRTSRHEKEWQAAHKLLPLKWSEK
jgi:hypothetical protein